MAAAELNAMASWDRQSRLAKLIDKLHSNEGTSPADLLRTVRLLNELPDGLLAKLAPLSTVESAAAQTVLFKEGTLCDRVYFVIDGIVALDMAVPRRDPTRILTVGEGEVLAWSALLSDQRMTATATVLVDARLVSIAAQRLRQLCDSDHEIGFAFMRCMAWALSRRLLATRLQLLDLFADAQPI
jgi:CRP/FNR family transcriptional regulator, cyclic AMP receptor protein